MFSRLLRFLVKHRAGACRPHCSRPCCLPQTPARVSSSSCTIAPLTHCLQTTGQMQVIQPFVSYQQVSQFAQLTRAKEHSTTVTNHSGVLLEVSPYTRVFMYIISFTLHKNLHIITHEKTGRKSGDMPKITQPASGRAGIWSQIFLTPASLTIQNKCLGFMDSLTEGPSLLWNVE